jgi:hypothetical protein
MIDTMDLTMGNEEWAVMCHGFLRYLKLLKLP